MIAPIKTLVVGYGLSARAFQLPFLLTNPAFKVVGIVQPSGDLVRQNHPDLEHFTSLETALANLDFELAVISTPNEFHAPMARLALQFNKHVLVEKPFAVSLADAEDLCQLASKQQKVLCVYHNRRWDADFLTLKELVQKESVGRPVFFLSRFDRFRPQIKEGWKEEAAPGTGILWDLGPHLIDQALQLWGWPASLYAHIRKERQGVLTPDAFDLFLYYPGLNVHLAASSLASAPLPRFVLSGTSGSYTKWGMDPQENLLRAGVLPNPQDWCKEPEQDWGTLVTGNNEGTKSVAYPTVQGNYNHLFTKLAQAIRGEVANPVPPEEALQVMKIIDLAIRSEQEGKRINCH